MIQSEMILNFLSSSIQETFKEKFKKSLTKNDLITPEDLLDYGVSSMNIPANRILFQIDFKTYCLTLSAEKRYDAEWAKYLASFMESFIKLITKEMTNV